ncbi:MAG: MFS transporter [Desulfoplanes sp.]|nr:MFS transporter [Desulfoplanes sp.]MDD4650105.1 MFS transporter [Desulfoplanes sp.]
MELSSASGGKRQILFPLFALTGIFWINFFSRIILSPLIVPVQQTFALSISLTGWLFLSTSAGYSVALFFSGFISARLTHHKTIVLSLLTLGVALGLTGASSCFGWLCVGLFLIGIGGGLYLGSGAASITEVVPVQHWGKAFALHETAPSVAFLAAPLLVEGIFGLGGTWRTVFYGLSGTCMLVGLAYLIRGRAGKFSGQPPHLKNIRTLVQKPAFWILTTGFGLSIAMEIGVYNLLPLYLVHDFSFSREDANFLLSMSRVLGLITLVGAGWLTDRLGIKTALIMFVSCAGLTTIALGWGSHAWVVSMLFIQPVFVVCFFPAGFAALSTIAPPKMNDLAVSLSVTIGGIFGSGFMPLLLAFVADHAGFSYAFTILGGVMVICLPFFSRLQLAEE